MLAPNVAPIEKYFISLRNSSVRRRCARLFELAPDGELFGCLQRMQQIVAIHCGVTGNGITKVFAEPGMVCTLANDPDAEFESEQRDDPGLRRHSLSRGPALHAASQSAIDELRPPAWATLIGMLICMGCTALSILIIVYILRRIF